LQGGERMTEEKIKDVMKKFLEEAKKIYGIKLQAIILYGSCARGDFEDDSDIDVLVLLNVPKEDINFERNKILDITDKLDLAYDVVLAPVFQNYELFQKYMPVSAFYQNVQREGVRIA
jgi:predicted nucleotidyltransferase